MFEFPPRPFGARTLAGTDWLLWIALVSGVALLFDARLGRLAAFARLLVGGGATYGVLRAMFQHHWGATEAAAWCAGLGLLLFSVWFATDALGRRRPGATLPLVLIVTATGLAVCAGLTGSAKLGHVTGILCACIGATMVLAWWRPGFRLTSGDITLAVALLFGLGLAAFFFSALPAVDALLLALAPGCAWLPELLPRGKQTPSQNTLLHLLAAALPVAIAVTRAAMAFELDPYADY